MSADQFFESTVEEATLAWLTELGWAVKHGSAITPGELFAERKDYGETVLLDRFHVALLPKLMSGGLFKPRPSSGGARWPKFISLNRMLI